MIIDLEEKRLAKQNREMCRQFCQEIKEREYMNLVAEKMLAFEQAVFGPKEAAQ